MSFERLEYEKVWTSPEDFPTYEDSEARVRADLQYHPDAIREFVNGLLDTLESEDGAASRGPAKPCPPTTGCSSPASGPAALCACPRRSTA